MRRASKSLQDIVILEPSKEYRRQQEEGSKGQQEEDSRSQEEDTKKLVTAIAGCKVVVEEE